MGAAGLIELARRYVACADELESLREQIKLALVNGAGEAAPGPFVQARSNPGGSQPANARATEEAKAAIVQLLKDQPGLGTSAIAQALGARVDTTTGRLKTLRTRGAIVGGGREGWRATAASG
jgi:hypothetical protein